MTDNVRLNPGVGGDLVATDEIDGAQHQLVKIEFGEDGSANSVSSSNPMPVITRSATSNTTLISSTTTSRTLLSSNATRKGYKIYNASGAVLYVKEGSGASSADYTYKLRQDDYYESAALAYTGVVTGVWSTTDSSGAQVTEAL